MRTYRRNPHTACRVLDGQAFVVTAEDNKLHTLNETATHLWELAASPLDAAQAGRALADRYEVDEETATSDATTCLEDLAGRGVLMTQDV